MNQQLVTIIVESLQVIGSGGVGVAIFKFLTVALEKKRTKESNNAYLSTALIYDELAELREQLNASRVLLMFTSNGGGVPSPSKQLYTSILYEVKTPGLNAIKRDWQRQLLDEAYVHVMRSLITNGSWQGTPNDLKEGYLKDVYNVEGIVYAKFFSLCRTETEFYYLVVRWSDENKIPTEAHISAVMTPTATKVIAQLGGSPYIPTE